MCCCAYYQHTIAGMAVPDGTAILAQRAVGWTKQHKQKLYQHKHTSLAPLGRYAPLWSFEIRHDFSVLQLQHMLLSAGMAVPDGTAIRVRKHAGWTKQHRHKQKQGITRPPNCGRTGDVII